MGSIGLFEAFCRGAPCGIRLQNCKYLTEGFQPARSDLGIASCAYFVELGDVTRGLLHEAEGRLWVPWAMAQQASARRKVELSIENVSALSFVFKLS
jgi:hypothetical protein